MTDAERKKRRLIRLLECDVYCRLMPSGIHGVGWVAIRDIPKGVNPWRGVSDPKWCRLSEADLASTPPVVHKMVTDYAVFEKGRYWVPVGGPNVLDYGYYINHSKTPNLKAMGHMGDYFVTTRLIEVGEELTIDYNEYGVGNSAVP